jgi:hypothetical protein
VVARTAVSFYWRGDSSFVMSILGPFLGPSSQTLLPRFINDATACSAGSFWHGLFDQKRRGNLHSWSHGKTRKGRALCGVLCCVE